MLNVYTHQIKGLDDCLRWLSEWGLAILLGAFYLHRPHLTNNKERIYIYELEQLDL